ncbi:MAG: hypothetical protein AAB253_06410, partial [candidate division NC10 bacterium]
MKPGASSRRTIREAGATPQAPIQFEFDAGAGRHRVWGTAFVSHEGLAVNLVGGDVPHIGAVAISIPRPSEPAAPKGYRPVTTMASPPEREPSPEVTVDRLLLVQLRQGVTGK